MPIFSLTLAKVCRSFPWIVSWRTDAAMLKASANGRTRAEAVPSATSRALKSGIRSGLPILLENRNDVNKTNHFKVSQKVLNLCRDSPENI
jgi:hypothetical protein